MRKLSTIVHLVSACFLFACGEKSRHEHSQAKDTTYIIHYNILIAPDLSNRLDEGLYPKPVSDYQIVKTIIDNLYPKILTNRRAENQLDKVSIAFINKTVIDDAKVNTSNLQIDFSKFENQRQRIDYIKARSNSSFSVDTSKFLQGFRHLIQSSTNDPSGADIWTFMNSGVDDILVAGDLPPITYNKRTYVNRFRNILVLLTDGYIEAGIYKQGGCSDNPNDCYYLSKKRVENFRAGFRNSGSTDIEAFFREERFGIVPAKNKSLKSLEVLVLEMYDRSLSNTGTPTVYPTDMDILKLFWSDWLRKSNVNRFEIRPIMTSEKDAELAVLSFLGIK